MKQSDDENGQEGGESTVEQGGTPGDYNDGIVSNGDDGGEKEDHEVAKNSEARAELEEV